MSGAALVERSSPADFRAMRQALAPDLVAWVTDSEGAMVRVEGRDDYLDRIAAMDLPAARFRVELAMVEVDAKPAESDASWAAPSGSSAGD